MKTQMRFQKYICLAMIIVGALATLFAFCYCTGSLAELGQTLNAKGKSLFKASDGKYDATLFIDIQSFNNMLMYFGIVMVLLAVSLYITSCNKRRNYYVTNFVATGACAGGNIILSLVAMILNGIWRGKFLNIDFAKWDAYWANQIKNNTIYNPDGSILVDGADVVAVHYSESTVMFDLAFVMYALVIVASVLLILNLVWKIRLMQGEKKLLGDAAMGGAAV